MCIVGFTVTLDLSSYESEFFIGCCFFIASVGSMSIYFGSKAYLLLSGAELNGSFQIVRAGTSQNTTCSSYDNKGSRGSAGDLHSLKTAVEVEHQINTLKGLLVGILAREAYAFTDSNQSASRGRPQSLEMQNNGRTSINSVAEKETIPPLDGGGGSVSGNGAMQLKLKSRPDSGKVFPSL